MRASNFTLILMAALVMTLTLACRPANSSLSTGMSMQDAIAEMDRRGLKSRQMAYTTLHHAFDLPDRRTVVLVGDKTVNEIQIVNSDTLKSKRTIKSVATFTF